MPKPMAETTTEVKTQKVEEKVPRSTAALDVVFFAVVEIVTAIRKTQKYKQSKKAIQGWEIAAPMNPNSTKMLDVHGRSSEKVPSTKKTKAPTCRKIELENRKRKILDDVQAYAQPIRQNTQPVMIEWWCHEKLTKCSELPDPVSRKIVADMCNTEKFATSFFVSDVPAIAKAAYTAEKITKAITDESDGSTRQIKITEIPAENLSAYAANTTDPGHEASTWASGSQIENGKHGTFTKTTNIARIETSQPMEFTTEELSIT